MDIAISLGLFFPLLGFLILMISSYHIGKLASGLIGSASVLISFSFFLGLFIHYTTADLPPIDVSLFQWIPIEKIHADFHLRLDPLSFVMTLIITGVGFLIHVYSLGYMEHERDVPRYFACMNLFVFFMLLLVLSGHLLLLFVGWEGVGLASYLLIGFWYEKKKAAKAATKAFIVNRVGDFAFLVALLLGFYLFETGDIFQISEKALTIPSKSLLTVFTLLLFVGACGKSAQIPLHTWLADAMAGPTPVSALIHAATMVTAGVYLLARMNDVYLVTPVTLQVVGIVGAITSLVAAFAALGQTDLKRVLAYSTVSQLGLMFVACGAGAFYPAMFHLTSHAFIKGLLFLSAGNIVHMLHGTTDMTQMGGLGSKMPKTRLLFLFGVLGLSGFPPLAAFFSKDLILEQELEMGYHTLFVIALATSFLTAVYLTRAYCLTFLGNPKNGQEAKEAPNVMLIPIGLLAICTLFGGFLGYSFSSPPVMQVFLHEVGVDVARDEPGGFSLLTFESALAFIGCLSGIFLSAYLYTQTKWRDQPPLAVLKEAFYFDELYKIIFVKPLKGISRFIAKVTEPKFFDAMITGTAIVTNQLAKAGQRVQSGEIRSYVAWFVMGSALLIVYFVS